MLSQSKFYTKPVFGFEPLGFFALPRWQSYALLTLVLFLSACATSVPLDRPSGAGAESNANSVNSASSSSKSDTGLSNGANSAHPVKEVKVPTTSQSQTFEQLPDVVYFDFDSFTLTPDAIGIVEGYAQLLRNQPSQRLLLEGHADEQGGREYNLALGQKRADAVMKALTILGASSQQIEPVSLGEEEPAVLGQDEAAWSKNRRVQIKMNRSN